MATPKVPGRTLSKMEQLVVDTKAELTRLGINHDGKRPEEILKMAREERNKPRVPPRTQKPKPE